jgi:GTP-binding protein
MSQFSATRFMQSAWQPGQFPPDDAIEVAFAGRSNAGKSSAINAILGRPGLARTSKTPGRTQLINFFEVAPAKRVVDLPGYGFAKVPIKMQQHWRELLTSYFEMRQSLTGLFIIMDSRRPLLDFDWQMLDWAKARHLSVHLVLTKADKLSRSEATRTLVQAKAETQALGTAQLFSATKRDGVEDARKVLDEMLAARR